MYCNDYNFSIRLLQPKVKSNILYESPLETMFSAAQQFGCRDSAPYPANLCRAQLLYDQRW